MNNKINIPSEIPLTYFLTKKQIQKLPETILKDAIFLGLGIYTTDDDTKYIELSCIGEYHSYDLGDYHYSETIECLCSKFGYEHKCISCDSEFHSVKDLTHFMPIQISIPRSDFSALLTYDNLLQNHPSFKINHEVYRTKSTIEIHGLVLKSLLKELGE